MPNSYIHVLFAGMCCEYGGIVVRKRMLENENTLIIGMKNRDNNKVHEVPNNK